MAKQKYWMVLGSGMPTVRHSSFLSASREAERLARQTPNTEFAVLECVAVCKRLDVIWEETVTEDDAPF